MFRERKVRSGYRAAPAAASREVRDDLTPSRLPVAEIPLAPSVISAPDLQWEADKANPFRRAMLYFALAAIYIRFSAVHEALAVALNLNLYLLYLVLPPAILGIIATGGIRRTLQGRTSRYFLGFLVWIFISTLFSAWRGGSAAEVLAYAEHEFLMLFVAAGLVMTWKEFKWVLYTLAAAGFTDLVIGRVFLTTQFDRVNLTMGGSTIANSNDYAGHMILMTAFMLYLMIAPKIPTVVRLITLPLYAYGLFLVVSTASRGAEIALGLCVVFSFLVGSAKFRIISIVAVPAAAVAMIALLPQATLQRLASFSLDAPRSTEVAKDAEGSSEVRRELFKKSIQYTIQHPLFGVGPAQFASYEGGESVSNGKRGMWHQTHNTLTQISSECGIPALTLYLCAIVSGFLMVFKTMRAARSTPGNEDIAAAAFCLLLGIWGFMSATLFLNFAYRFYQPAFCGLCLVLYNAAKHEMAERRARAAGTTPFTLPWAPQVSAGKPAPQPWPAPVTVLSNKLR